MLFINMRNNFPYPYITLETSISRKLKKIIIEKIIRKIFWNLKGKLLTVLNMKLTKGCPPLTLHHGPSLEQRHITI